MKSAEAFCRAAGTFKPPSDPVMRRLAKSLAATYNIQPRNDDLVLILGEGKEPNNLKAIEAWIRKTLLDLDEDMALDVLSHLVFRFGETLEQWEVSRW